MMAEKTGEGHPRRRSLGHGLCKCGRLREFQAHPEAEADEYGAGKEGKAPTPIDELRFAQKCAEQQKQTIGCNEPHWCAKLWKHAEARSPARRGVLNRQQSSAAPFAAEAKALSEAKDAEQERRDPSDHRSEEHTSELQSLMRNSYAVF